MRLVHLYARVLRMLRDESRLAWTLAPARNADRILVFEDGRVVEEGTFDELTRLQGRFAALAKAQFMTAEPEPAERRTGSG
jgi:ATP-binding cassette subfamily B protein